MLSVRYRLVESRMGHLVYRDAEGVNVALVRLRAPHEYLRALPADSPCPLLSERRIVVPQSGKTKIAKKYALCRRNKGIISFDIAVDDLLLV